MRANVSRYPSIVCFTLTILLVSAAAQADPPTPPPPSPDDGFVPPVVDIDELIGRDLDPGQLQQAAAAFHARRNRPLSIVDGRTGALSGLRIAISPGHGTRWVAARDDGSPVNAWEFQRGITQGLREDLHNNEWAIEYLIHMIERAGGEVINLRERTFLDQSVLVDNDVDDGRYSETGEWEDGASPGNGGTYRYAWVDAGGTAEARWSFEVPRDGAYPVYVFFLAGNNRSEAALYRVEHAEGTSEGVLSQAELLVEDWPTATYPNTPPPSDATVAAADLWHYLGTFPFRAGETSAVVLSNQSTETEVVVIADAVHVGGGLGTVEGTTGATSGRPRWEESASTFLEWLGVPGWLKVGDVSTRPLYSIYRGVDFYFSVHTNCCDSSGTSTWTWYPDMWVPESSWPEDFIDEELPPGTFELATAVHSDVIARLRANWESDWRDGGHWGANFGELRAIRNGWYEDVHTHEISSPMTIPAVLMEVAFHDMAYDAGFIRELRFRHDVARGFLAGLIQFLNGEDALIPPLPPREISAAATENGLVVRWSQQQDPVAPTATSDQYLVYVSRDGVLFDPQPIETTETTVTIPVSDCEPMYVRVAAVNGAGESLDSSVVGGRFPLEGAPRILYVNGVDREVQLEADPTLMRDYARIYGPALADSSVGAGFDITTDDRAADALTEATYDLVVWATGETSTRDESLSTADQNVIRSLLESEIPLLISGAETGWDLVEMGTASDSSFFEDILGATYETDDADTTLLDGSTLGLPTSIAFGDCSADSVCMEWPDVLSAQDGGEVILPYDTGTGAVVRSPNGLVATAGFPFETVADSQQRKDLITTLATDMLGPGATDGTICTQQPDQGDSDPGLDAGEDLADLTPDAPLPDSTSDLSTPDQSGQSSGQTLEVNVNKGCGCRTVRGRGLPWLLVPFGLVLLGKRR